MEYICSSSGGTFCGSAAGFAEFGSGGLLSVLCPVRLWADPRVGASPLLALRQPRTKPSSLS